MPKIHALTDDGIRHIVSNGIFCGTCGVEILLDDYMDEFLCLNCCTARREAAQILWEAGTAQTRRASRLVNVEAQYDASYILNRNEILMGVLLRQPRHDRHCSCKAKL